MKSLNSLMKSAIKVAAVINSCLVGSTFVSSNFASAYSSSYSNSAHDTLVEIDAEISKRWGLDENKKISMENGYYNIPCVNGTKYRVSTSEARDLENALGTSFDTLVKFRQEYIAASSNGRQEAPSYGYSDPMTKARNKLMEIDAEISKRWGLDENKKVSMENGYYNIPCVNGSRYTVSASEARELENVLGTSFDTLVKFRQEYAASAGAQQSNQSYYNNNYNKTNYNYDNSAPAPNVNNRKQYGDDYGAPAPAANNQNKFQKSKKHKKHKKNKGNKRRY